MNPEQRNPGRDIRGRIYPGMRIPRFNQGMGRPLISSSEDINLIVDAVNSLNSMGIQRGDKDNLIITDANTIIQLGAKDRGLSAITPNQPTLTLTASLSSVIIGQVVTYTATYSPASAGHVVSFNVFQSGATPSVPLTATTNGSGIATLVSCNLGMHFFGTAPAVITGPITVIAGVSGGPTSNSVVITVTDPGTVTVDPALKAFWNAHGFGMTGTCTGAYQTYDPGGPNTSYFDTGGGFPWLQGSPSDGPFTIFGGVGHVYAKSDADTQCPIGQYTVVSDTFGGAPSPISCT